MDRPVPIPNTAVKRNIADGSGCIASARVGSRQIIMSESRNIPRSGFLLCVEDVVGKLLSADDADSADGEQGIDI